VQKKTANSLSAPALALQDLRPVTLKQKKWNLRIKTLEKEHISKLTHQLTGTTFSDSQVLN